MRQKYDHDWNLPKDSIANGIEQLVFDPICDCFSKAQVIDLIGVEDHQYQFDVADGVIEFSFQLNTNFDCGIRAHNFYDLAQYSCWRLLGKYIPGNCMRLELSRTATCCLEELLSAISPICENWEELESNLLLELRECDFDQIFKKPRCHSCTGFVDLVVADFKSLVFRTNKYVNRMSQPRPHVRLR